MNPSHRSVTTSFAALILLYGVLAGAAPAGQAPAKPGRVESARFDVVRTSVPIRIDGVLDEEAWAAAPKIPVPISWTATTPIRSSSTTTSAS